MAVKLSTVIAGVVFLVAFVGAAVFMALSGIDEQQKAKDETRDLEWWQHEVIYHLLIPSFRDTNKDGFGDIKGRTSRVRKIASIRLGVSCPCSSILKNYCTK